MRFSEKPQSAVVYVVVNVAWYYNGRVRGRMKLKMRWVTFNEIMVNFKIDIQRFSTPLLLVGVTLLVFSGSGLVWGLSHLIVGS